jgi:hypothetical protein
VDGLDGRKPRFDQQLQLALISEPGDHAVQDAVGAGEEQTACPHEGTLELHLFLEHTPQPLRRIAGRSWCLCVSNRSHAQDLAGLSVDWVSTIRVFFPASKK